MAYTKKPSKLSRFTIIIELRPELLILIKISTNKTKMAIPPVTVNTPPHKVTPKGRFKDII